MESLKAKNLKQLTKENRSKKLKELELELIKSRAGAAKGGGAKIKEIKKTIARILMLNKFDAQQIRQGKVGK